MPNYNIYNHIIMESLYTCKYTYAPEKDFANTHIYHFLYCWNFKTRSEKGKKKKRQQYNTKIKISKDCIYHFKRRAFLLYNCISPVTHKRHDHSKQQWNPFYRLLCQCIALYLFNEIIKIQFVHFKILQWVIEIK